jgi:hypothetical protein
MNAKFIRKVSSATQCLGDLSVSTIAPLRFKLSAFCVFLTQRAQRHPQSLLIDNGSALGLIKKWK